MAKTIIEVYNAHGLFQGAYGFEKSVIQIGRGYQNDLILHDRFVDPGHVIVREAEPGWQVEDLGSHNGLFIHGEVNPVKSARLKSGDEIILGKTHLRFLSCAHEVPPAKNLVQTDALFKRLNKASLAWPILLFTFGWYCLEIYLAGFEKFSLSKIATGPVWLVVLVLIWSGIWAFVGRLIKHHAQFHAQVAISSLFFLSLVPAGIVIEYIGYFSSSGLVEGIASITVIGTLVVLFLMGHLSAATNTSRKMQTIVSSTITLLMIVVISLSYFVVRSEFNARPVLHASLKPPFIKIFPASSVDQFLKKSESVFK